jgi:DNA polymerase III subunit beta
MKVQVNNSELLQALGHIQSIVEKRTAKSILSNVKITTQKNKISFYTTDLDIFAKESINASVGGQLTTTVPIHIFYEIIRKIGVQKEIQLIFEPSDKPGKMLIKAGLSEFSLPCLSAEEFPDFEEGNHSCEFEITSNNLHYLIATTKHAISYDETRYYLSGVFLHVAEDNGVNVLRAVATDVHRLAIGEVILPKNAQLLPEIIIPKKTVFELTKLLENFNGEVPVGVSSNKITFQIGNTTLVSKLIDGKFPDYDKAVPYGNAKLLEVSTSELAKAIDLVTAISTEKTVAVKLRIEKNKVTLSVSDKINSSGTIEIPAIYSSDEISIAFNAKYIIDILNNLTGKKAYFKLNSGNAAVLVEDSDNTNCRFVLMPMQI